MHLSIVSSKKFSSRPRWSPITLVAAPKGSRSSLRQHPPHLWVFIWVLLRVLLTSRESGAEALVKRLLYSVDTPEDLLRCAVLKRSSPGRPALEVNCRWWDTIAPQAGPPNDQGLANDGNTSQVGDTRVPSRLDKCKYKRVEYSEAQEQESGER